jgi:hypothetical protein
VTGRPHIARQPRRQNLFSGLPLQLEASLFPGSTNVVFQWFKDSVALSGETNLTLLRRTAGPKDSGQYQLSARNHAGTDLSRVAKIEVDDEPPFILKQPADVLTHKGGLAEFTVAAEGSVPLRYQWLFNGAPLPNETNVTLQIGAVRVEDAGEYAVRVEGPFGNVVSHLASLRLGAAVYLTSTEILVDASGSFVVGARMSEPAPQDTVVGLQYGSGDRFSDRNASLVIPKGGRERSLTMTDLNIPQRLSAGESLTLRMTSTDSGVLAEPKSGRLIYIGPLRPPPQALLRVTAASAHESDGKAIVELVREGELPDGQTVQFFTKDSTAKAGEDYQATAGTIRLGDGQRQTSIEIPIYADNLTEGDETFDIVLTEPSPGLVLRAAVATVTIVGDVHLISEQLQEGDANGQIGLRLPTPPVAVRVRTSDGTAKAGEDYLPFDQEIPTGGDVEIPITLLDDGLVEGPETLNLVVSVPGELTPIATFQVTIADNEIPASQDESFYPAISPEALNQAFGTIEPNDDAVLYSAFDNALYHLSPNGELARRVPLPALLGFEPRVLAGQSDRKLLLGGAAGCCAFDLEHPPLVRLNEDGTLDSFGLASSDQRSPAWRR